MNITAFIRSYFIIINRNEFDAAPASFVVLELIGEKFENSKNARLGGLELIVEKF